MKKILVFDVQLDGHHLEYLHHIYMKAAKSGEKYVFCVPADFVETKGKLDWPLADNVVFDMISVENEGHGMFANSYYLCKLLKKCIKRHSPTHVFLISLMAFLPFLPLFIPRRCKLSGIVYLIYLYRWKNVSALQRIVDVVKYTIFSYCRCFDKVYILNDKISPVVLNKRYGTSKYVYLPDPYLPIKSEEELTRTDLGIEENDIVFFHFGALAKRKGTMTILNAIDRLSREELENKTFVFMGKVLDDLRDDFYSAYQQLRNKAKIILSDEFCSYSRLASVCKLSNYLLLPYENVDCSSGVIGYAAQFGVPVVAPKKGLLGKLVRRFHLGYTYDSGSMDDFMHLISCLPPKGKEVPDLYLNNHRIEDFNLILEFV